MDNQRSTLGQTQDRIRSQICRNLNPMLLPLGQAASISFGKSGHHLSPGFLIRKTEINGINQGLANFL